MGFLSDIGNAISSAASAVGDVVEDIVDAVVDTVEDAVDTVVDGVQNGIESIMESICKNAAGFLCGIGNFLGGLLDGLLEGVQEILHDTFDLLRDLVGLVGSVLRLDLPGFLKGLGKLVVDVLDILVDAGRFLTGGYIVGGIVDAFKRSTLLKFVAQLVQDRFGQDPAVLSTVRQTIGLEGKRFGFRLPSEHRVFAMDSASVDLWRMHNDGVIDLYAMAGLLSFDSFSLGASHPNTVVTSVGSDGSENLLPINRFTISRYIDSEGVDRRLRVYAMSRPVVAQMLATASRKLKELAVIPEWNDAENFAWFRNYTRQEITEAEYDFNSNEIESLLARPDYNRPPGINCSLVALGAFKLDLFGRVGGRDILECEDFPDGCQTPGRTDECCNTINRRQSSGVIYRDVYPTDVFQYVLAHEIGHYLGLCHCGHDGFLNVMFSSRANSFLSLGLLSLYWDDEPHFSLEDGKNTWRFIVDQLAACLTGEPEIAVVEKEIVSSANSCAVARQTNLQEPANLQ